MKILIMNLYWSIQIQILQFKGFVMHESKLNSIVTIFYLQPLNTKEISRFVSSAITKGQREAVKLIRCRLYMQRKNTYPFQCIIYIDI